MQSIRLIILAFIGAILVPAAAWAQDDEMTFELDDVEEEWGEEEDWDDDTMTFAVDDIDETAIDPDADPSKIMDVGVVVVPSDALSDAQRNELQTALLEVVRNVPNIVAYGDSDLLPALMERDPEYCSRESLCLAGVGRNAGVHRIVQARVERSGMSYRLDLDYFDVSDRIFVAYHSNSDPGSFGAVKDALVPGVRDIFGIRTRGGDDPFVDDAEVNVQRVLAFSTAGLSVVALGTGAFFGSRVRSQSNELTAFDQNNEGQYTNLTQVQAQDMQREMQSNALAANMFFGIAAISGVASVLMFVLNSDDGEGDHHALHQGETPWYGSLQITPRLDRDGAGVGARIRF